MKKITFSHEHSLVPHDVINQNLRKLEPTIKHVASITNYEDPYASIHLIADEANIKKCVHAAQQYRTYDLLILIGIGGANLGAKAAHEAIQGLWHNAQHAPTVLFVGDTVDPAKTKVIYELTEIYLNLNKKVVINCVSKSGSTTETIAVFEIFAELFKKHKRNDIVITTTKGSAFWKFAEMNDYQALEVPQTIGDRYAVFSAEGLFPLAVLGVDIHSLIEGARAAYKDCITKDDHNIAATSAIIRYHHYINKRNVHDQFYFASDLESCGKWYRQLMGESVGKELDNQGKQVFAGITPTVSIGTTDLHSVGQLYLGGPQDKYTTFFTVEKTNDFAVPDNVDYEKLVSHIQGKKLHDIMHAIISGVQTAFSENARPFSTVALPDTSAYSIGQLLQTQLIEMMYIAALLNVNAFDQPHVEGYKEHTRKLLAKK